MLAVGIGILIRHSQIPRIRNTLSSRLDRLFVVALVTRYLVERWSYALSYGKYLWKTGMPTTTRFHLATYPTMPLHDGMLRSFASLHHTPFEQGATAWHRNPILMEFRMPCSASLPESSSAILPASLQTCVKYEQLHTNASAGPQATTNQHKYLMHKCD